MRGAGIGILVCGVALAMFAVGCGGDDDSAGLRNRGGDPTTNAPGGPNAPDQPGGPTATPAETACAAVAPAQSLSDIVDAKDVRIAGKAVFFTSGAKVFRVMKDLGKGATEVFTSPDLVRSYVDRTAMITIEASAVAPDTTTLRVVKAAGAEDPKLGGDKPAAPPLPADFPNFPAPVKDGIALLGTTATTNYNAAGTHVFASDEKSFYLLADTAAGDAIVMVSKDNPAVRTTIATSTNVITHPQIASGAVWYVRDQQRIFKVALATEDTPQGEPVEVFGVSYSNVNLAVNDSNAFITAGNTVERRDLTGGNPTMIFDAQKGKTAARLGATIMNAGALYVRSEQPDEKVKHVIREIKPSATSAEEKFVACGRGLVTGVDVDGTHVVWTEQSGVFIAPR
jgi:hypothetical protein